MRSGVRELKQEADSVLACSHLPQARQYLRAISEAKALALFKYDAAATFGELAFELSNWCEGVRDGIKG